MKVIRFLTSVLIFGLSFSLFSNYSEAEKKVVPLIIEPVYPENQNPQTKGYFDLSVKANDKQSLKVRIFNNGKNDITVSMRPADAYTNPNGGILYENGLDSPNTVLLKDSVRMADFIKIAKTINVPAASSVDVPIVLEIPDSNGQNLLGGILFTTQGDEKEQQQKVEDGTANFVLKTETVYAVALQLNLPNKIPVDFKLGEAGFIAETGFVYIEMFNYAKKIEEEIKGEYTLSDQSGKELFKGRFGPFKMAPKTMIRYPIKWGSETLEDGRYNLHIQGSVAGNMFSASKSFTISNRAVTEYVEKTQNPQGKEENEIPIWVWIGGAVLFGVVMFMIGKRRS